MSQATASNVTVLRADSTSSLESLNTITNAIRTRAAQIAQGSGGSNTGNTSSGSGNSGGNSGSSSGNTNDATSNWLQAERDLFNVPEATLTENDNQFSITITAAGCDSNNLEVIATSNSVIVRSTGMSRTAAAGASGNIVYSDIDSRMLFRRFDVSSAIDTSQVSASLDNGMLTVNAQKANAASRRSTAAKA